MSDKRAERITEYKVAILVLGGLVIFGGMILRLGVMDHLRQGNGVELTGVADDVSGLLAGAPVHVSGIPVGKVGAIDFSADNATQVTITMQIREDVAKQLREDASFRIETLGLLGDKYLSLKPGVSVNPLPPGSTIQRASGSGLDAVLGNATKLGDRFSLLLTELTAILKRVEDGEGSLGKLVSDPSLHQSLVSLSTETTGLVKLLQSPKGSLYQISSRPDLANSISHLQSILARIDNGDGSMGKFVNDEKLHDDLDKLIVELDGLIGDPKKYLKYIDIKVF